jgi:hypothetical protein
MFLLALCADLVLETAYINNIVYFLSNKETFVRKVGLGSTGAQDAWVWFSACLLHQLPDLGQEPLWFSSPRPGVGGI